MSAASTAELDQTIAALQGELTSVPPTTALDIIDSFEQQVQGLGASEIASDLSTLKQLLTSGSATGSDIGQVLTSLGKKTTLVASGADAEISTKLKQLGGLLTSVGNSLLGATLQSEDSSQEVFGSGI